MRNLIQDFEEIAALTQIYLLETFEAGQWIEAGRDNFLYFKEHAKKQSKPIPKAVEAPNAPPVAPKSPIQKPLPKKEEKPASAIQQESKLSSKEETGSLLKKAKEPEPRLSLTPLTDVKATDFSDLRKIIGEKFPQQKIIDEPQSLMIDKSISVIILTGPLSDEEKELLGKVIKAIRDRFCAAALVNAFDYEVKLGWESLLSNPNMRLILAPGTLLASLPNLMQYHRELPKGSKHYLSKVPLYIMADWAVYLKDNQFKAALWKAICDELNKK